MLKVEEIETESQLISLVDNIDFKQEVSGEEFIVLIKKQSNKSYSTLYLTDCEDSFWLKKIDICFLEKLKDELKLRTDTETFIKCFVKSLKTNSKINLKDGEPNLEVKLEIGEGLTMTLHITFNTSVNREKDNNGHKIILKLFLRQLYESKQTKENTFKKEIDEIKHKKVDEQKVDIKKDTKFYNEIFNLSEKSKDPHKTLKNRDLLNPNRQKRKHAGVKLGTTS